MRFSAKQFATAWYQSLTEAAEAERDAISRRYLETLQVQGELKLLPAIVRSMEELDQAKSGKTAVTVRSRHELPEAMIADLVKEHFGDAEIRHVQDDAVIGGVQLETANTRIDLSVRGRLRQLHNSLQS